MLPATFRDKEICIIGLGYVGMTLAVAMSDAGFRVRGVEKNEDVLYAVEAGAAHFSEVGLDMKLKQQLAKGNLTVSDRIPRGTPTSTYIVSVGTPVDSWKKAGIDALTDALEEIAEVLNDDDLVVLRSTIRVGTTRSIAEPILRRSGRRFDLAFCPERTLEGKALLELRTLPQIVGGLDDAATFRASQLFLFMTPSVIRVRNPETAEMVKLVNNTQRDYVFAFANEVAAVCDLLGISAAEVIASGNLGYPRANLPMPGPVGGPCLSKDVYILAEGMERLNFRPSLALAARSFNEELPCWSVSMLANEYRALEKETPRRIAILGVAFKGYPETDDLRGTMALPVIHQLRSEFDAAEIVGWDPVVPTLRIASLGIAPVPSIEEAFEGSNIVVIQNNHQCFGRLDLGKLSRTMQRPGIVYDYWNQFDPQNTVLADGVSYRALGAFNLDRRQINR